MTYEERQAYDKLSPKGKKPMTEMSKIIQIVPIASIWLKQN